MDTEQTENIRFIVKTKMTEDLYQYGNQGFRSYSFRTGGWKIWAVLLGGMVLTGMGALISGGTFKKIYTFAFGMFFLVFLPLLIMWLTRKLTVGRAYKKVVKDAEGNLDQVYTFGEECMNVKRWYEDDDIKYSFVVFLLEMPEMFMIFTRNNKIYYFRKSEIEGGTADEFKEFLEKKAEIKAEFAEAKG